MVWTWRQTHFLHCFKVLHKLHTLTCFFIDVELMHASVVVEEWTRVISLFGTTLKRYQSLLYFAALGLPTLAAALQ
jgi:hypothetical protein